MFEECEGIIIRQTKTLKGRRMILMLTDKFGKISAGTSISERGKSKSALSIRPFTHGRYQLNTSKGFTNISSGEVIHSYYGLAENYDKFVNASFSLEFTSKILPENANANYYFTILQEYLSMIEARKRSFSTVTNAYLIKLLQHSGVLPEADIFEADELLSTLDSDIVNLILFFRNNPLSCTEKLALQSDKGTQLLRFLVSYAEQHLDIGPLKSGIPKGD